MPRSFVASGSKVPLLRDLLEEARMNMAAANMLVGSACMHAQRLSWEAAAPGLHMLLLDLVIKPVARGSCTAMW